MKEILILGTLEDKEKSALNAIESRLDEIIQRQKIARFDTVMLLAFPLLLAMAVGLIGMVLQFGTSQKNSAIFQFSNFQNNSIMELLRPDLFLYYWGGIIAVAFIFVFGKFILAYLHDSLKGRIDSCGYCSVCLVLLGAFLFYAFLSSPIHELCNIGILCADWLHATAEITMLIVPLALIGSLAGTSLRIRLARRAALWFQKNAFKIFEQQDVKLPQTSISMGRLEYAAFLLFSVAWGLISLNAMYTRCLTAVCVANTTTWVVFTCSTIVVSRRRIVRFLSPTPYRPPNRLNCPRCTNPTTLSRSGRYYCEHCQTSFPPETKP